MTRARRRLASGLALAAALLAPASLSAGAHGSGPPLAAPPGRPAGVVFRNAPARADGPASFVGRLRGGAKPQVILFTAIPAALPASGGVVRLEAVVQNASRCRFSSQQQLKPLPVADTCDSGTASVRVHVAPNHSAAPLTYRFVLSISGRHGKRTAPRVAVSERAAPAPKHPATTSPPPSSPVGTTKPPSGATSPTTPAPGSDTASRPVVTAQPADVAVLAGATATFTAAASGSPEPTVQWQVSSDAGATWSDVPGATSPTYSFTATAAQSGDHYQAVFTNAAGATATTAATLTVASPPLITVQPADATVVAGQAANFSAAASGSPTPTVRWQVSTNHGGSWSDLAGATSQALSFPASTQEDGDEYRAVFTNSAGPATTSAATLTVTAAAVAPRLTEQPSAATVVAGQTASFSATASGSPTPTVQWRVSTDGGGSWSDVAGATATTYSFTATAAQSGDDYEAVFTNSAGSATSAAAALTVTSAPQVTTQPSSTTVLAGQTASFTAAASGSPVPTVQWQVSTDGAGNWSEVAGATSSTYSFTTSPAESGYEYRAVFTNSAGSATTSAATLTLTDQTTSNWSGYVATGATFSAVTGAWTAPTVTCPSPSTTTYSSHWVGIDGYPGSTVEQAGTEADCAGRTANYDAWYELFGDSTVNNGNEVELAPADYPVRPGDSMSASVRVSAGTWTLAISDGTSGWHFSTQIAWSAPAQSSAEWIGERPTVCNGSCGYSSLADFGSLRFTSATATAAGTTGPISSFSFAPVQMLGNAGALLAAPGPLDPTGEGFTDTWYASS